MKNLGIAILVLGLIVTMKTGFDYVISENAAAPVEMEITRNKKLSVAWQPIAGVAVMIIGGGLLMFGINEQKNIYC
jgi:hypothetical protein